MTHEDYPTMLTRKEAAAFLGLAPVTLEGWARKQNAGPPYVKLGKAVRYRKEDLVAFIEDSTVGRRKFSKR